MEIVDKSISRLKGTIWGFCIIEEIIGFRRNWLSLPFFHFNSLDLALRSFKDCL